MHLDHLACVNQLLKLLKGDADPICAFHTNIYITLVGLTG
jgi:hypothetical protein